MDPIAQMILMIMAIVVSIVAFLCLLGEGVRQLPPRRQGVGHGWCFGRKCSELALAFDRTPWCHARGLHPGSRWFMAVVCFDSPLWFPPASCGVPACRLVRSWHTLWHARAPVSSAGSFHC